MQGNFQVRTDLALETRESFAKDHVEIRGVRIEEAADEEHELYTTTVVIETENGARAMGKPVGNYITLEAPNLSSENEEEQRRVSEMLAGYVRKLLGERDAVLVVGLGNREVTPDALGPQVVNQLQITRHMVREYGKSYSGKMNRIVSAVVPGVMAQTGMETLEMVRGIVRETKPEAVIAIDALAARSTRRLNRTIQITDTGINPGSGVGNHREGIREDLLGIPVIAIGVPTVVDAATIVNDAMEQVAEAREYQQSLRERIAMQLSTMFVTPKDIDETIRRVSFTLAEALNIAFSDAPISDIK
ncbi:MAG: GPR endopeptidase [Eubacteriales bacterium]|nr:GPR endopeptidase [Eubacteriales bacterium]